MTGSTPWVAQDSVEPIQADTIGAIANVAGFNTLAGCAATYSGVDMTKTIAAGSVTHTNAMKAVAGNAVTLVSDPTNPRWTYTYINSSGVAAIVSGSASATPAVPDFGANVTSGLDYIQAALTVASNATYKLDKRVMASILGFNGGIIASATTLPITAQMHHVSGTTPITTFPTFASGVVVFLTFDGACPITYNATSLILIGGVSITTTAGDTLAFRSEGAGNWRQIVATAPNVFDGIRLLFRGGRKLLGEYGSSTLPKVDGTSSLWNANFSLGFAFGSTSTSALPTVTQIGGEQYDAWVTGTTTTVAFGSVLAGNVAGAFKLPTAPNKSPRMLLRWIPGASNANLTTVLAGFLAVTVDNAPSATSSGAYLRANTTGNLFFVTRQGASETTTDLGARPTVLTSYEIETADAGVTWTCRNSTTGVVVATSTTNVPTAATAVGYGFAAVSGSGSIAAFGIGYARVEANFTP